MKPRLLVLLAAGLWVPAPARADDWPQWRGPERNGVSKETGLLKQWTQDGPKLLWKAADLGGSSAQSAILMLIVIALTVAQFRFVERKVQY